MPYNESRTFAAGQLIQKMRKDRGITQERLCEGLCSVATLSRIEAGKLIPKGYLFQAIVQRLGYHAEKCYSVYFGKESYTSWHKRDELDNALFSGNTELAEKIILELSGKKEFAEGLGLQFILNSKVSLARQKGNVDHSKSIDMLYESIRLTIPEFNEECINRYLLAHEEIVAINILGNTYLDQKDFERASDVYSKLLESMDEFCFDQDEKAKMYPTVLYNYTKALCDLEKYDEAIALCIIGQKFCIDNNKARQIPVLMTNQGWCLVQQGKKDEAFPIHQQAYYTLLALHNLKYAKTLKDYILETYGVDI